MHVTTSRNQFKTLSSLLSAGDSGLNCRFCASCGAAEHCFPMCCAAMSPPDVCFAHSRGVVLRRRKKKSIVLPERDRRCTLLRQLTRSARGHGLITRGLTFQTASTAARLGSHQELAVPPALRSRKLPTKRMVRAVLRFPDNVADLSFLPLFESVNEDHLRQAISTISLPAAPDASLATPTELILALRSHRQRAGETRPTAILCARSRKRSTLPGCVLSHFK